jgi:lysophospholipase
MSPILPPGLVSLVLTHVALLSCTRRATAQRIPEILQQSVTDYAPLTNVECPDISTHPLLRTWTSQEQALHPQEAEYIDSREKNVLPKAWKEWLGDGSRLGYDLAAFEGKWPRVGIAIPGGGLRAAQYGGACLEALDARNDSAKGAGTGGLLQVSSYMTGLSGTFDPATNAPDILRASFQAVRGLPGLYSSTAGRHSRNLSLAAMGCMAGCLISHS